MLCCYKTISESSDISTVTCSRCGHTISVKSKYKNKVHRNCNVPGLGDRVQSTLSAFGITKARVNWAKRMFGLRKPCGCDKRRDALNELGKALDL